ncbi:MAG: B12-binding domain-containing radical SAM protein [Chloroflexi bacterium]|nr:B12-binding domain-containing radical SAM protein [Chloroflexota bacterium]
MVNTGTKKKCADIVFILPKAGGLFSLNFTIGLAYMRAYLESLGVSTALMPDRPMDMMTLIDRTLELKPKIIGFTTYDPVFFMVNILSKAFKEKAPDILQVAGGPTATFSDGLFFKYSGIDVCVRGEGEYAIVDLLRHAEGKSELGDIEGISFPQGDRVVRTPLRPLIGIDRPKGEELDILPSPHLAGVLTGLEWAGGIQTSRGCAFHCTFCNGPNMFGYKVRYHSIDRVINDLKYIEERLGKQSDKRRNDIWDDNFCLDKKRTRELCERIVKEKIKLFLHAEIRADRVDKDLMDLMYAAGVRMVNFGLESGVPRVLRNIKKVGGTSEDLKEEKRYIEAIRECVDYTKNLGMLPSVSFINGLPGETLEEGRKTVEVVKSLGVHFSYHNRLTIFSGTELMDVYKDYGLELKAGRDILPYEVAYTYDLSEIPFLVSSFVYHTNYKGQRKITDAVFGWWSGSRGEILEFSPVIVIHDFKSISPEFIEWLRGIARINASIYLLFENELLTRNVIDELLQALHPALPTRFTYFINRRKRKHRGRYYYQWLVTRDIKRSYGLTTDFHLVPISQSGNYRVKKTAPGRQPPSLLYTVNTRKDVKSLKDLFTKPSGDMEKTPFAALIRQGALICDGCRWQAAPCPGADLLALHVMHDGSLRTCVNGGPVGKIGDSEQTIKARLLELKSRKESERGCSQCKIKDNCSKCLFPYPLSDHEYCEFRRANPWTGYHTATMEFFKDYDLKQETGVMKINLYHA